MDERHEVGKSVIVVDNIPCSESGWMFFGNAERCNLRQVRHRLVPLILWNGQFGRLVIDDIDFGLPIP